MFIGKIMSGSSDVCDTVVADKVRSKYSVLFAAVVVAAPLLIQMRITVATLVPSALTLIKSSREPSTAPAVSIGP